MKLNAYHTLEDAVVFKHDVSPSRLRHSFLQFLEMLADDQSLELSPSPELPSVKENHFTPNSSLFPRSTCPIPDKVEVGAQPFSRVYSDFAGLPGSRALHRVS